MCKQVPYLIEDHRFKRNCPNERMRVLTILVGRKRANIKSIRESKRRRQQNPLDTILKRKQIITIVSIHNKRAVCVYI